MYGIVIIMNSNNNHNLNNIHHHIIIPTKQIIQIQIAIHIIINNHI